jgi:AmmeMemoRadiSam system protein A
MHRMSPLSNDGRRALLNLARRAISTAIIEKQIPDFQAYSAALTESAGAFVTLHQNGLLRGCVGQVESTYSLAETVARAAISAALHDSRFPPVDADEIPSLEIEISVLLVPEPISPEAIVVGCHGLVIEKGANRGLLLPQVASERRWTSQRFLEETCVKAGLPRDAWSDPSTCILAFSAEVFSDTSVKVFSGSE